VIQNFGFGMYEGITGLVTKPMEGHKKEGAIGLLKGMGKGPVEFCTKPASGE
jgi:sterol 3beta-glucosyltransferase